MYDYSNASYFETYNHITWRWDRHTFIVQGSICLFQANFFVIGTMTRDYILFRHKKYKMQMPRFVMFTYEETPKPVLCRNSVDDAGNNCIKSSDTYNWPSIVQNSSYGVQVSIMCFCLES